MDKQKLTELNKLNSDIEKLEKRQKRILQQISVWGEESYVTKKTKKACDDLIAADCGKKICALKKKFKAG